MTVLQLDMKYSFKESHLSSDFCPEQVTDVKQLVNNSTSFTVVGLPGMGISMFLKFLVTQPWASFLHIDVYDLPELNKFELFKLLISTITPAKKSFDQTNLIPIFLTEFRHYLQKDKADRIVLVFNRFDRLSKEFNQNFFDNLRAIRDLDKERIVMIFSANKPIIEQFPDALHGGNLTMYSHSYYLKPYQNEHLKHLLRINAPAFLDSPNLEEALTLSGGHYQLLMLLLRSKYLTNSPLQDVSIKVHLEELYEYLNYSRRKILQKIALNKNVRSVDSYLLDIGYIVKVGKTEIKIFTPLLRDYIKSVVRLKLPAKEYQLYKLLKNRLGGVVTKEEIFNHLWRDNEDGATDWALNALIYRLRKNPTFSGSGYVIESYKKIGYQMVKG